MGNDETVHEHREFADILDMRDVHMTYASGTVALSGASLRVGAGTVHGLVGANGAGKSTLIKILSGAQAATSGSIQFRGKTVSWPNPAAAQAAGVATVYQDTPLVPTLSVLENAFLGRRGMWRSPSTLRNQLGALLAQIGLHIDVDTLVSDLSIGSRQMVALVQALACGAQLIVMDEPTASLAESERQMVFDAVREVAAAGKSVLYVTHFLDEIFELTSELTVIRDGRTVLAAPTASVSEDELVQSILGKKALSEISKKHSTVGETAVLQVRGVSTGQGLKEVDLTVREGEILGIAGLLGSGRSEVLHAIFGADPRSAGSIQLDGREVPANVGKAVHRGIALVPEDRKSQGIFPGWEIWRTTSLPDLGNLSWKSLVLRPSHEQHRAQRAISDLGIRAVDSDVCTDALSGGNAQKVMFGKWLYGDVRLLLLDEPTAGVDVGAKADIFSLIRGFAAAGNAVIIVASEFEELLRIADRVIVVRHGRCIAERDAADTNEHELLALASGLTTQTGRQTL
ncbi:sugar ABC transporter ATP-binding protein [Nakamurella antarctica]|uniref:Sugar ABC transporter ATP-binding protein n=1 Tax=Nakamurella antarctica TaxID=1902245 RepID=A0A3G8ZHS7_9ACTN|nr:sugar ABC transporter ATP-binding protein [Nakamurella antarctica]AZI56932.1 sugar ABC transporter ATP-binding protein [Nakamurella antarctica]